MQERLATSGAQLLSREELAWDLLAPRGMGRDKLATIDSVGARLLGKPSAHRQQG